MPVLIEKINVNNIPTLIVYKENSMNSPVVFFVHGYGSKKEKDLNIGFELASRGIVCIHIDARQHGERLSPELVNTGWELKAKLFYEIVKGTTDDVSEVITYYSNDKRVNTNRSGMAGISMGGFITYYVLTKDKRIKAAAPIIATPAWGDFILSNKNWIDDTGIRQILDSIIEIDPVTHYKDIYPRALLIQNGKIDPLIPYFGAEKLYCLLEPLYKDKESMIKIYIYDTIGHDVIEPMREKLYDFFLEYL